VDLQSKVGQLFFIGLDAVEETPELAEYLDEVRPGGVILFSRNLKDPAQVRSFASWLTRTIDPAPFIAIDMEGGRVNRLREFVGELPPAVSFAPKGQEARLAEFGRSMARLLRPLGVTMNFAPCVDLSEPGASSGIGDRAFGTDPERVTELAGIYVDALQGEGVAAVLKHFPGLGPTDADTHQSRPSTKKPVEDLWNEDMLPFRRLMDKAAGIMIGHAHYAMVDQDRDVAATLSTAVVNGLLRQRMGFNGLAMTDDLEMGAVSQEMTPDELALFSLLMGSDMVMFQGNTTRILNARRGLVRAIHAARLFKDRIDASVGRITAVKERFAVGPLEEALPQAEYASARDAIRRVAADGSAVA
jgi:beta-N-acetylhexosaminidase